MIWVKRCGDYGERRAWVNKSCGDYGEKRAWEIRARVGVDYKAWTGRGVRERQYSVADLT